MKRAPGARSGFEAGAARHLAGFELPRVQVISAKVNLVNGLIALLYHVSPILQGVGIALLGDHHWIRSQRTDTKGSAWRLIIRVAVAASDTYAVQRVPY